MGFLWLIILNTEWECQWDITMIERTKTTINEKNFNHYWTNVNNDEHYRVRSHSERNEY